MAVAVALIALAPYLQTGWFEFINLDDYRYVKYSPVARGLTWANLKWALQDVKMMANWHPLTYLSLMADVTLFGPNPGAMHLVNAGMHAAAAGLLFLLLAALAGGRGLSVQVSGAVGPSAVGTASGRALAAAAFGALVWALHPLRAESVAWISSRKDVLSALFCIGGLLAHLGDVRIWQGGRAREVEWGKVFDKADLPVCSWRAWVAFACFGLGYMAKPTMMVFPAFVALIEWLEAGRIRWKLLALYAAGAVAVLGVTVFAQGEGGAITDEHSFYTRLLNAAVSISVYLRQFVIPRGLTLFYPYPKSLSPGTVALGVASVAGLVMAADAYRDKRPVVACGVAWFVAALVPVLGFIQVGGAAHADRYTYLPMIGFSLILAAWLRKMLDDRRRLRYAAGTVAGAAVLALLALTWRQVGLWRDDQTLFTHALGAVEGNFLAHRNLGIHAYSRYQDHETAIRHLALFLEMERRPHYAERSLYVLILAEGGHLEEAKAEANRLAQGVDADLGKRELGTFIAYAAIAYYEGDKELAKTHAEYVQERVPNHPDANYLLGLIAQDEGRLDDAVVYWERSLKGDFQYQFIESRIREIKQR
jgi:tetratricopeptide (TPR) repeat protein